jgi:signal transduction histidine kinase
LQQRAQRGDPPSAEEIAEVEKVLQEAMTDMRGVAAGLRLPELTSMTAAEVAERAVVDHERRSNTKVELDAHDLPSTVPLPVRIALFRAMQESLSNATRHGGVDVVYVELQGEAGSGRSGRTGLLLVVRDAGSGFDPSILASNEGLGLAGIREQAEVLGGTFAIASAPGAGTELHVWWPAQNGVIER